MIFFFTSCTLIPKYERPDTPIPKEWPKGDAYKDTKNQDVPLASELGWREFIPEERLQILIEIAMKNNHDLKLAALNVEKARVYYGIQRATLLPTLDAIGSESKQSIPSDLSGTGRRVIRESYSVDLGILS